MERLIDQLKDSLNISEDEAVEMIQAITEYVENQHPLLKDMARELLMKELEKNQ